MAKVRDEEDAPARFVRLDGSGRVIDDPDIDIVDPMAHNEFIRGNDRRHSFTLVGWCELCSCEVAICFKQHKGETHLGFAAKTWMSVSRR